MLFKMKLLISYIIYLLKNTIKVAPSDPDKKWYETWQGALWVLSFSQMPGGNKRFQEWNKFITDIEEKEKKGKL